MESETSVSAPVPAVTALAEAALGALPDPVLIVAATGQVLFANTAARRLLGPAVVGRPLADALGDPEAVERALAQVQEGGVAWVMVPVAGGQGGPGLWQVRGGLWPGLAPGATLWVGRAPAIDPRERLLQALARVLEGSATTAGADLAREVVAALTETLELSAAALLLYDPQSERLHLAAQRGFLAESLRRLVRQAPGGLTAVLMAQPEPIVLDQTAEQGPWLVALPLRTAERVVGALSVVGTSRPLTSSDLALLQSFAQHVTLALAWTAQYAALVRERAELEAALRALPAGVCSVSPEGQIRLANPAAAHLVGRSEADLVGRPCREALPLVDEAGRPLCDWACPLARGGADPVGTAVRAFVVGPDGQRRAVNWSCSVLREPSGRLLGWLEVVQDVSHLGQLEELRGAFISAASHELLTPITIIKGHAEALRQVRAGRARAQVQEAATAIEEEADRLQRLVKNMLDVAQIQAGAFRLELAPLALPPLIERIVQRFRGRSRRHQFVVECPEAFPIVMADRDRIESVLYNLLDNAVKYSPQGGTIRVGCEVQSDQVVVRVSDEGVGIPWQEQDRIFERFYRGRGTGRTRPQGSGLGLFIARAIVEAHGGRIWVESRPGRGSTFYFSLPREAPADLPAVVDLTGAAPADTAAPAAP